MFWLSTEGVLVGQALQENPGILYRQPSHNLTAATEKNIRFDYLN